MFIIPLPITMFSPGEVIYWLFFLLDGGFGRSVTSLQSFPASRRPGEHSLYLSGVLRGGDPVLYVIYCHFCTD